MKDSLNLPPADQHGWKKTPTGGLEFDWCEGSIMPTELVDIIRTDDEESNHEDDVTENVIGESLCDTLFSESEDDD